MELSAELSKSENCLSAKHKAIDQADSARDEMTPPPIPPPPLNYQRSDGSYSVPFNQIFKNDSMNDSSR